jgi:hypothetical protein
METQTGTLPSTLGLPLDMLAPASLRIEVKVGVLIFSIFTILSPKTRPSSLSF